METTPPWEERKRVSRDAPAITWQSTQNARFLESLMHGVAGSSTYARSFEGTRSQPLETPQRKTRLSVIMPRSAPSLFLNTPKSTPLIDPRRSRRSRRSHVDGDVSVAEDHESSDIDMLQVAHLVDVVSQGIQSQASQSARSKIASSSKLGELTRPSSLGHHPFQSSQSQRGSASNSVRRSQSDWMDSTSDLHPSNSDELMMDIDEVKVPCSISMKHTGSSSFPRASQFTPHPPPLGDPRPRPIPVETLAKLPPPRQPLSPIIEKFKKVNGRIKAGDRPASPRLQPVSASGVQKLRSGVGRTLGMKGSFPSRNAAAQPFKRPLPPGNVLKKPSLPAEEQPTRPGGERTAKDALEQEHMGDLSSDSIDISLEIDPEALEGICSQYD